MAGEVPIKFQVSVGYALYQLQRGLTHEQVRDKFMSRRGGTELTPSELTQVIGIAQRDYRATHAQISSPTLPLCQGFGRSCSSSASVGLKIRVQMVYENGTSEWVTITAAATGRQTSQEVLDAVTAFALSGQFASQLGQKYKPVSVEVVLQQVIYGGFQRPNYIYPQ